MNEGLIPGRYAKALFETASDRGDTKRLYDMMRSLSSTFAAQPDMRKAMENPFIADADKLALLRTATGAKSDDTTFDDFLKLLVQNRRLPLAAPIAIAYEDFYRHANNIYRVEVVSAASLDNEVEQRLKQMILSHLDGGSMEYTQRVDPSLIGGFTVSIDNRRLDASVRNELKQLRLNLLN